MSARIDELIDKVDTSELVRDEIAAILAVESARQQELAEDADEDPSKWKLRVFLERANPWGEFLDATEQDLDTSPIVNVRFDTESFDGSRGNVVEQQQADATYHIDCYGFGLATEDDEGHRPGDLEASLAAQRAVRLTRNILMAGTYAYLGHRGLVGRRWVQSITMFQPVIGDQPLQQIVAGRITFEVRFNEYAPQVQGEPLELLSLTVKRAESGEVFFAADYSADDS